MAFAQLRDIILHYRLQGHGEPLLLIMGYRGSGFMWTEEFLELLAGQFQVIAFDNRGTGLSTKPNTAYTIATVADDAAGLLAFLGIARATIFGVSMGGMIAQELALRHPRRVKRLILGCTSCGGPQAIVAPFEVLERLLAAPHLRREDAVRRQWPAIFSPNFLAQQPAILDRLTAQALAYPTPFHTAVRQMLAVQRFTTYGRLGQIVAPTLVVSGDADILVPPANSTLLARRIHGASLHLIPDVGHGFFWETPEAVGALLGTFCARL